MQTFGVGVKVLLLVEYLNPVYLPPCVDNGTRSVQGHVVKGHLVVLFDALVHCLLCTVDKLLEAFVDVFGCSLVETKEVDIVFVKHRLFLGLKLRG